MRSCSSSFSMSYTSDSFSVFLRWDLSPHVKKLVQVHEYRMAGGRSSSQDISIIPFSLFPYLLSVPLLRMLFPCLRCLAIAKRTCILNSEEEKLKEKPISLLEPPLVVPYLVLKKKQLQKAPKWIN